MSKLTREDVASSYLNTYEELYRPMWIPPGKNIMFLNFNDYTNYKQYIQKLQFPIKFESLFIQKCEKLELLKEYNSNFIEMLK